jgi:hypothetical protein
MTMLPGSETIIPKTPTKSLFLYEMPTIVGIRLNAPVATNITPGDTTSTMPRRDT